MSSIEPDDPPRPGRNEGRRERKKTLTRRAIHEAALRFVEQQGLDGTTVEQICEAVDISPRTFFNYFPSKSAAALNLPESVVSEEGSAVFHAAQGDLVPALCELIGSSMDYGTERRRMKELLMRRPELLPAFAQWMGAVRGQYVTLAEERTDTADAEAAVALTMAAMSMVVHDPIEVEHPGAERLLDAVDRLVAARQTPMRTVVENRPAT
ncbi:AcrR family transcriptional regulator [Microbacterium resistens]|uniref:AcrR family transcriptional regulator n=1 Tax=Microbacterium resistens TaxID=156977 RepID=A0ABU1SB38_9MICO|nr:TetR family transcriptional regulator [Microbacterium resistens]MDR6866092.1 AcrR family transcriptional regulator [Microbacterium resistens]